MNDRGLYGIAETASKHSVDGSSLFSEWKRMMVGRQVDRQIEKKKTRHNVVIVTMHLYLMLLHNRIGSKNKTAEKKTKKTNQGGEEEEEV